ncbi:MAG: RimK family protein [Gammaproteobacteria bacterium]|nr:RimK family protein [Gammaproteobacteria bacterium]
MRNLIIVDDVNKVNFSVENAEFITAKEYLTEYSSAKRDTARVYNLCKSYKYQSAGYYVSLLALARGHKVLPSITTIQDLKSQTMIKFCNNNLKDDIEKSLSKIKSESFIMSIYFGKNVAKQHARLCKKIFDIFRAPLLRVLFQYKNNRWRMTSINVIALNDIPEHHVPYFKQFAEGYFQQKRYSNLYRKNSTYDLAILVNHDEENPPSDEEAINKFINAAEALGFCADLLSKDELQRIPEYDALFIRETTSVNHHTYNFARRAFAEGLVVIDDPDSIIKCTNKVYIAELLKRAKIAAPKTLVVNKHNTNLIAQELGFPCVLKEPDGSFSNGVIKIDNENVLKEKLSSYFASSELKIAQAFMPTEFDWRIGVLDKQPIFACKYYMAANHWQIYNWRANDDSNYGDYEAIDIKDVPGCVVTTAIKAANLIGDGFYGVDLKEYKNRAYVIEINDNPSVDSGVEDGVLGKDLYLAIMKVILKRIQYRKGINYG